MPPPGSVRYGTGWKDAPRWVAPLTIGVMVLLLAWLAFAVGHAAWESSRKKDDPLNITVPAP